MLKKILDRFEGWLLRVTNKDYQLFREELGNKGMKPAGRVLVCGNPEISNVDTFKVSFDEGQHWIEFHALAGTRSYRGVILSRKSSDYPNETWLVYDKISRSFIMYEQTKEEKLNLLMRNFKL